MRNILKTFIVVVFASLFLLPAPAYAAWNRDGRHSEHRDFRGGHFGHDRHSRSHFGISFIYNPWPYYHSWGPDYTVVYALPPYYQTVLINGVTYYVSDGTYYVYTSEGYRAVPPPVVNVVSSSVIQPYVSSSGPVQTVTSASTAPDQNLVSVNVPDNLGGYRVVNLQRSGNGFVGPQGEYYTGFPSADQLRAAYGN